MAAQMKYFQNSQPSTMFNQSIPLNNGQFNHMGKLPMSDNLKSLPTDKNIPSESDIHMTNSLFGENKSVTEKIIYEGKDMIIIGILFVTFSLPQIDEIIQNLLPITKTSNYILIASKALMVMILFWLIKHFYLSRNN